MQGKHKWHTALALLLHVARQPRVASLLAALLSAALGVGVVLEDQATLLG